MGIARGNRSRASSEQCGTERSHMVIEIVGKWADPGVITKETHRLLFVDLVLPSASRLDKLDFAFLNKSLLSLLKCVSVMSRGGKDAYVPFRDSLLTKLLREHITHNEATVCLGCVNASGTVEEALKTLDFLAKVSALKIKRASSAQIEAQLTPGQFKDIIVDLQSEKTRLQQIVSEGELVTPRDCDCEARVCTERNCMVQQNDAVRLILAEKLNYLKCVAEAKYANELNVHDLSRRKRDFMEQTLNESGRFVARGGNIEDFISAQDARFKRDCAALERVIATNYETE